MAVVLAFVPEAAAQDAPPQPNRSMTGLSPVIGYGIMALGAAAVIGASLMPAKRGHQD
jgi:hypothetical protein